MGQVRRSARGRPKAVFLLLACCTQEEDAGWCTAGEKFDGELSGTQVAQQRAIDELARRVAKIEQRLNQ